jgi:hypothetical protein
MVGTADHIKRKRGAVLLFLTSGVSTPAGAD